MGGGEYRYETDNREDRVRERPRRRRRRRRAAPSPFLLLAILAVGFLLGWFLHGWAQPLLGGSSQGGKGLGTVAHREPPACPEWITQDFLPRNPCSRPGDRLEGVAGIVVHYVGNPGTTAEQNHSYFASLAVTRKTYASSHFLVGLDGEILQNIPLDEIAYCSNDRNGDTIAIECCHPGADGAFTDATYASLVKLVKWLADYYGLEPGQVIRHYDVTGKECPLYFVDHPEAWERFLQDIAP